MKEKIKQNLIKEIYKLQNHNYLKPIMKYDYIKISSLKKYNILDLLYIKLRLINQLHSQFIIYSKLNYE